MLRQAMTAIAFAAALTAASALSAPAQAHEGGIDGGPGGAPFRVKCDGFVTGFEGRTGAYIDNFRLDCGAWNPAARRLENRGPLQIQIGTSEGGGPSAVSCPDGWFINSIRYVNTLQGSGPGFVHHIHFACVTLAGDQRVERDYGPTTPVAHPDMWPLPDRFIDWWFGDDCPKGEFMTGLQGRSGLYVDALGLLCDPIPAPAPAPAPQVSLAPGAQVLMPGSAHAKIDALGTAPAAPAPAPTVPPLPVPGSGKSDEASRVASGQSLGFTGTWNTKTDKNWTYLITFIQDGANVQGTYVAQNGDKGRIKGTVKDQVLQFNWEQDGGFTGTGQFALAADGNSFTGIYQGNPHAGLDPAYRQGSWNGTRR